MKFLQKFFLIAVSLCFFHFTNLFAQTGSVLTFSEIMFRPLESNGEFIEIYNISTTETIDLTGFKFKYYTSSNDNLVAFIGGTRLAPGKFAVVVEGDYDYNNGVYKNLIPPDAIVLKIGDNSFGTSGMANTTSRDINLINPAGQIIDTYTYSADNQDGISDEKYILDKNNAAANWKNSLISHGTPGKKNSVSPVDYDIAVSFLPISPTIPTAQDSVKITILVKNLGRVSAPNFSVDLFIDENSDSIGQSSENILSSNYSSLAGGDSVIIEKKIFLASAGEVKVIAQVNFSLDENVANNKAVSSFTVAEEPAGINDIVINEIMYAPSGDEPEWIEIYNVSSRTFNLKGWKIGDNSALVAISISDLFINTNEYLVISRESSISNFFTIPSQMIVRTLPTYSNSGDDVILKDLYNRTIDSLKYQPAWGGNTGGKSLERISAHQLSLISANWKTSQSKNKATPGRINSVSQKNYDLALKNFNSFVDYAEIGKSLTLRVIVENLGLNAAQEFNIELFRDMNLNSQPEQNELVTEKLLVNLGAGSSQTHDFLVTDFELGLNQFIVQIEYQSDEYPDNNLLSFNINGIQINEQRGDLVINEIMYAPNSPEPEWIEIFNTGAKTIEMKGYQIADDASRNKVVSYSLIIQPEEYLVIASDSSILSLYSGMDKIVIATFPSLNNGGDRIVLSDSLGRTIDSLIYKSYWGGAGGKSLERVDALSASTDSTNWKTSIADRGGTPGKVNTVSKKKYDVAIAKIIFTPVRPMVDENVSIKAEVINQGKNEAAYTVVLSEILENGSKQKVEESETINLSPNLSSTCEFKSNIIKINRKHEYEVRINFSNDEDTTNNIKRAVVCPGYPPNSVLVNEIMYNPLNSEPEWVELYNNSSRDIDLDQWSITDVLTTPVKFSIMQFIFPSKSLLVISKDNTIFNFHRSVPSPLIISPFANLNNDADGVVIKDSRDVTIDSVRFDKSWGGENGKSLERVSFTASSLNKVNWSSSKDLEWSTPGRINSLSPKNNDLTIISLTTIPQFPAYNEQINLAAKVFNNGMLPVSQYTVKFYFIEGSDTIYFSEGNGVNLQSKDSTIVLSNEKFTFQENKTIYCKVITGEDEDLLNNYFVGEIRFGQKRNSILITEIMYNPFEGESEWIELYNASQEQINLKNFVAGDIFPTQTQGKIALTDAYLQPGEYAILTPDTNKFPYYPPPKFYQVKFGSLSNTTDGIVVYDYRGAVIDSVVYSSKWGGEKGYSLERISFSASSNDSTNWTTSINPFGATPGFKSSLTDAPGYQAGSLIINEIMYDPNSGNSEFLEFYNTMDDSIQIGGMTLFYGSSNKTKLSQIFQKIAPKSFFVFAGDTSIYNSYPFLNLEGNKVIVNKSLSLSNEGSILILRDIRGNTLDSLCYSPSWHNRNILSTKNKSLERLNPAINSNDRTNWSTSVNPEGATPGKSNSVYASTSFTEAKVTIIPNPFSPDNDGFEDFATINFNLTQHLAQVRIRVFDSQGRLVRTLTHNLPSASKNSLIFDGLDDSSKPLRIGIYVLLIEAVTDTGITETIKTPIVVARKL